MSELTSTIKQICDEKGLSLEAVVGTIESALAPLNRLWPPLIAKILVKKTKTSKWSLTLKPASPKFLM